MGDDPHTGGGSGLSDNSAGDNAADDQADADQDDQDIGDFADNSGDDSGSSDV
jgi:hypothetical protein